MLRLLGEKICGPHGENFYTNQDYPAYAQFQWLIARTEVATSCPLKQQAFVAIKQALHRKPPDQISDAIFFEIFTNFLKVALQRRKRGITNTTTTGETLLYHLNNNCRDLYAWVISCAEAKNILLVNQNAIHKSTTGTHEISPEHKTYPPLCYRDLRYIATGRNNNEDFNSDRNTPEYYHQIICRSLKEKKQQPINNDRPLIALNQVYWLIRKAQAATSSINKRNAFNNIKNIINDKDLTQLTEKDVLNIFQTVLLVALKRHKYGLFHPGDTTTCGEELLNLLNKDCPELLAISKHHLKIDNTITPLQYQDLRGLAGKSNNDAFHGSIDERAYYRGLNIRRS